MHIGLLLRGIRAARREGNLHLVAGLFRGFLDGCAAAENDQVGKRDLLPARLRTVEILLDGLQRPKDLRQFGRLVDFPILLGREADACPVGAAAHVAAAEGCRRRPGRRDQLGDGKAGRQDLGFQRGDVLVVDQFMIHSGNRVLPEQRL